jgi:hypothetical protein
MKIKYFAGMLFLLAAAILAGCGGGGGGGTAAPATTVISGVAAKGLFTSGTVKIYGVNATSAAKGDLLKTTALDALGTYNADIGSYTGPVVIEVIGTYNDEATGVPVVMAATDPPLRALIANASGNVTAMVTPLTELAAQKVGTVITASVINTMNGNIATLFKLDDITKTKPVDATTAAAATATAAEKNQSLVLAAISQLVKNSGKPLGQTLTGMAADISGTTMADKSIAGFKTALFDFISDTAKNKTGITDTATAAVNIGGFKIAHLKINTAGLAAAAKIGGIDFTFNLPAGVTVAADATTKEVAAGIVVISGTAAAAGTTSISTATFSAPALRTVLASAQGFGAGEFVDISCTIPAGNAATAASFTAAITAATLTAKDLLGAPLTGVTLTTTVDVF